MKEELSRPETPGRLLFMTTCKNCANTFEGNYCPNCSQKGDTHRFTVKHLAHEFFHAFTHADKGIIFLAKELFIRPGIVAREFNAGKRKKYFNPITYLLLVMALQIYLTRVTDINTFYVEQMYAMNETSPELRKDENYKKGVEVITNVQQKMFEYNKLVNFIFIPILSFLIWMMFRKSGSNYAEVLVLNTMYISQTLLLFVLICIIPFVISTASAAYTMNVYMITSVVYMAITLKQFFQQGWGKTILKTLVIQVLYYVIIFLAMLAATIYFFMM